MLTKMKLVAPLLKMTKGSDASWESESGTMGIGIGNENGGYGNGG